VNAVTAQGVAWKDSQAKSVPAPDTDLAGAVLATLAYADLFDHPLTAEEVHRQLVAVRATLEEVTEVLHGSPRVVRVTTLFGNLFTLAGRDLIVEARRRREASAMQTWPQAWRWGRALAALPHVRMVAVTGALAVDAVDPGADIDTWSSQPPAGCGPAGRS
jgi:hypothetical protein